MTEPRLDKLFRYLKDRGGSDLHLAAPLPPHIRLNGELQKVPDWAAFTDQTLREHLKEISTEKQWAHYCKNLDLDFAYAIPGVARFRVNFLNQERGAAAVFRIIPEKIRTLEELKVPPGIGGFADLEQGLVLVTGPTGSGKSTTLAAMIDTINRTTTRNVITVEDPIEFLHRDRLSFIHQREVGLDTQSFHDGLRYVLRQDPDIILVGEIRDLETMGTALMAADTGHVVMSTLHTTDVVQSIQRIISFYPPHQHDEIRMSLSANLRAVISQRLIPRKDGAGRVPAVEVMVSTPTVREYILDPDKIPLLHTLIAEGVTQYGMQTFDQSVLALLREGLITEEEALKNCNNPNELSLKLKGISATSDRMWQAVDATTPAKEPEGAAPSAPASHGGGGSKEGMSRE